MSFGASVPVLLGPDREPGLSVTVRLAVPPSAAPGAYWSDITVTTGSSGSGDVKTGTQATAPFVFTVGPSATPPPPCGDLDVAYSTGEFPAWPTPAFKTTSWQQVFARQRPARPAPEDTCPTATAGPAASAAPSYCPSTGHDPATVPAVAYSSAANAAPAANAPAGKVPKIPSDWPGWLILIGIILLALAGLRRRMRS